MQTLTFQRHENVKDGATNSLWRLDRVDAFNGDGEQVGFLKISYVPGERVEHWHNDIYAFLADRGSSIGIHAIWPLTEGGQEELGELAYDIQYKLNGWRVANSVNWKEQSIEQLLQHLENWRAQVETLVGPQRQEFISFHVDKPLVDFIQVEEGFRGLRLSRLLYQEGAAWMAERGLELHASGLQQPAAARIWEHMALDGQVVASGNHGERRVIRPGKTPTP